MSPAACLLGCVERHLVDERAQAAATGGGVAGLQGAHDKRAAYTVQVALSTTLARFGKGHNGFSHFLVKVKDVHGAQVDTVPAAYAFV